jgi:MFS family permease
VETCEASQREDWIKFAFPTGYKAKEFLVQGQTFDPCHVFPLKESHSGSCLTSDFNTSGTPISCIDHVFDKSIFQETAATKFRLICDRADMASFLSTIMMFGLLIGSMIGGRLSDKWGRKKALLLASLVSIPSVVLGGIAVDYWMYAVLRLISCTCLPIIWYSNHSLVIEIFSTKYRTLIGCFKNSSWPIAMVTLPLLSYFVREWSQTHFALGALCTLTLLPWFFIPESPRWLLENSREEEALNLLKDIAKSNNRVLTENDMLLIRKDLKAIKEKVEMTEDSRDGQPDRNLSILNMFHRSYCRITLLVILCWSCAVVGGFTLTLNATKLEGNIFFNFALCSLADWVCYVLIYTVTKIKGRAKALSIFLFLTSMSCFTLAFMPKDKQWMVFLVYMCGNVLSTAISICIKQTGFSFQEDVL